MPAGKVEIIDFVRYFQQVSARFDWKKDATGERAVRGMSGNQAAQIIAGAMAEELTDEAGANVIKDLQAQLRAQIRG